MLPDSDNAFTSIDFSFFLPKSTELYFTHAPLLLRIVFHPLKVFTESRKATDVPVWLLSLYRSISILAVALVTPTPRKVGNTFLIVPSALKNRLSMQIDRFLSNLGE